MFVEFTAFSIHTNTQGYIFFPANVVSEFLSARTGHKTLTCS